MSWTDKEAGRARPVSRATDNFAVSRMTTGGSGSPCRSGRPGGPSLPARAAVLLVKGYQKLISPWLGQRCRFHPSCSNYCIDALHQHGMVIGLWLGVKRICKCHPFHPGGFDPVPRRTNARSSCGFPPQRTPRTTENPTSVNSSDAGGE